MLKGNGKEEYRNIRGIRGDLYAGHIRFETADTDAVTVECVGTQEEMGFCAYQEDGVLYLQTHKGGIIKGGMSRGIVTVTLPGDGALEEIELLLKAGELSARRLCARRLLVDNGAGQVNIEDFWARQARLSCGAGSLCARGDAEEKLQVSCAVGQVSLVLRGQREEYAHHLECSLGEIRCGEDGYSGMGRAVCRDGQGGKELRVTCGIGRICIDYAPRALK